jgi:hypothetical protein
MSTIKEESRFSLNHFIFPYVWICRNVLSILWSVGQCSLFLDNIIEVSTHLIRAQANGVLLSSLLWSFTWYKSQGISWVSACEGLPPLTFYLFVDTVLYSEYEVKTVTSWLSKHLRNSVDIEREISALVSLILRILHTQTSRHRRCALRFTERHELQMTWHIQWQIWHSMFVGESHGVDSLVDRHKTAPSASPKHWLALSKR